MSTPAALVCACGHVEDDHWGPTPGTRLRPCCATVEVPGRVEGELVADVCPCAEWRPRRPASARARILNTLARWLS